MAAAARIGELFVRSIVYFTYHRRALREIGQHAPMTRLSMSWGKGQSIACLTCLLNYQSCSDVCTSVFGEAKDIHPGSQVGLLRRQLGFTTFRGIPTSHHSSHVQPFWALWGTSDLGYLSYLSRKIRLSILDVRESRPARGSCKRSLEPPTMQRWRICPGNFLPTPC